MFDLEVTVAGPLSERVSHLRGEADLDLLKRLEQHRPELAIELVEVESVLEARPRPEVLGASAFGSNVRFGRRLPERVGVRREALVANPLQRGNRARTVCARETTTQHLRELIVVWEVILHATHPGEKENQPMPSRRLESQ